MIEKLISNPLTLKRWRKFKNIRRAKYSSLLFAILLLISLTAEFWANSAPIILKYNGELYFPAVRTYHPSIFAQTESMVVDYRKLEETGVDWSLWPPVKWDPFESNEKVETYPSAPSNQNILGTDDRGRDVLARIIYGFRYSIVFALLVWMFSFAVGVITGAIMGFVGGRTDLLGQRVVEVFDCVPGFLLLLTLISIFGANLWLLIGFSTFFGWMSISIYMRAEFLKLRSREFVEAAKAMGGSQVRIIFKHILPNALSPIVTFSPFAIAGGISALAALDYLGFGLPPPTPSWGELFGQAQKNFTIAWWLAVYPSLALFLSLVVLNLIGEGVREAFDPRKS